ncbi:13415_t:CDS:2 [Funneliformis caledonium]|uniref:13415_t:CDS:1 n=1 Tax=Funneliformis caledonium TaxID=1117310 RepID=A0A9N8Z5Y0_9GLOM|nr:13415_t:CDS:2 [Funneliformis caledonium]
MFSNTGFGLGPSNSTFLQTQPFNNNDDGSLEIYLHKIIETPKGRKVECNLCKNIFNNLTTFNNHVKKKYGYKHLCRICCKVCTDEINLTSHMKEAHKQFPCDHCQKVCWGYHGLKNHVRRVHLGVEPPPASKFNSVDNLNSKPMVVPTLLTDVPSVKNNRRSIIKDPVFLHEYQYDDTTTLICKLCKETFDSNKEFNKHAKVEHETKFICFNCSQVFQEKKFLGRHINIQHKRLCQFCGKIFNVKESLDRHVREIHSRGTMEVDSQEIKHEVEDVVFLHEMFQESGTTLFKCKLCDCTFKSLVLFKYHARYIHFYEFLCTVCCQLFASEGACEKHMELTHTKDFSCNVCPKKFYDKAELNEHSQEHICENFLPSAINSSTSFMPPTTYLQTNLPSAIVPQEVVREDDVTYLHEIFEDNHGTPFLKCKLCQKIISNYTLFRFHAKKVHKYEWLCLVCCQVLPTRYACGSHMKNNHTRCFPCTVCPKTCFDYVGLNEHFRAKHPDENLSSGESKGLLTIHEVMPIKPKSIKCKICSGTFSTQKFNKHMRLHDVKISCRYCFQAFYEKRVKKEHEKQFHRFSCKECKKHFLTAKSLSDHCSSKKHQKDAKSPVQPQPQPQPSQLEIIRSTNPQNPNFAQEEGSRSKKKESPEFLHDFIKSTEMENVLAEYLLATYNFKCKLCKEMFRSRLEFNEHVEQEHDLIHICEICSQVHYNDLSLQVHRKYDHSIKEFYCNYCDSSYYLEKDLHDHIFGTHLEKDAQVSMEVEYANEYEGCDEGHSKMQEDVNRTRSDDDDETNLVNYPKCEECNLYFRNIRYFEIHNRNNHHYNDDTSMIGH